MTALRKKSDRSLFAFDRRDLIVDYSDEVTPEQIRQVDESVRKEFATGNWVTVEQES